MRLQAPSNCFVKMDALTYAFFYYALRHELKNNVRQIFNYSH